MSAGGFSCRHAFTKALLEAGKADARIYAVTSDAKMSVTLQDFEAALPSRFVEAGIAEQDAVGIAAGLASCGKRVFVCGPASFYTARSLEQVKNDVTYADSDVKIVGVSGGVSYGALGSTHHSLHDIAVMRTFPGLSVFLPCDVVQTMAITKLLAETRGPAYMRLGREPVPEVYKEGDGASFSPGKAIVLKEGKDCAIAAAGETVYRALAASEILSASGIRARVLDFWSIKPLDEKAILDAARDTGLIVSVEEHHVSGGLGSAIASTTSGSCPVPVRIMGFPDEWPPAGSSKELFGYYGMSPEGIAATVLAALKMKRR